MIVGAGDQGLVVASIIAAAREAGAVDYAAGFLDDRGQTHGSEILGIPVLGAIDAISSFPHEGVVVAIGDNAGRRRITDHLEQRGEQVVTVRHPFSSIGPEVTIGRGSIISAGTVITPGVKIGRGVILNTSCTVDHESVIGDFAHISVGSTLGGNVTIGDDVLIGLGASVMSGVSVGEKTVVGAGSLVIRDVSSHVIVTGVPAQVRRQLDITD